jgi:hypothetical protein
LPLQRGYGVAATADERQLAGLAGATQRHVVAELSNFFRRHG